MWEHREAGFTFLELLLVLVIISVLTIVGSIYSSKGMIKREEVRALEEFQSFIESIQMMAKAEESGVKIHGGMDRKGRFYEAVWYNGRAKSRHYLPQTVEIIFPSTFRDITFNSKGELPTAGTLYFYGEHIQKRMTFQFQYGRMIVYDQ